MKIIFLSTDTYHHWYLINKLKEKNFNFDKVILETTSIIPSFETEPFYKKHILRYEKKRWGNFTNKNADFISFSNINNKDALRFLKELKPDYGIVFGTRKLSEKVINSFKKYLINIHRGICQEYRGLDSEYWPLYHKDYKNIGVTIHKVDKNLDTGDIISQKKLDIKKLKYIFELRAYTTEIATNLIIKFLNDLRSNKIMSKKQKKLGRYYSFMPLELKKISEKNFNNRN